MSTESAELVTLSEPSNVSSPARAVQAPPGDPRPLVVGNWKLHGSRASAQALIDAIRQSLGPDPACELALCVPFPYLELAQRLLRDSPIAWGAQTLSEHRQGAHTGEVSAGMLADLGCRCVIVGHSERRSAHAESDAIVGRQAAAALRAGLTPIVCVGESLAEREAGQTDAVVLGQLDALADALASELARGPANEFASGPAGEFAARSTSAPPPDPVSNLHACVIAYEPLWAIGTGRSATPQQAQQVHASIRQHLAGRARNGADAGAGTSAARRTRILYGGSVKPDNAAALFAQPDIDGGLVGGASLVAADFVAIARAAG